MKEKLMNYSELMTEAATIYNDRHTTYGDMQTIMERISQISSMISGIHLTPHDIALVLLSVKLARMGSNRTNKENYVDGINYFAFAGALVDTDYQNEGIAEFAARYAPAVKIDD
jgi:hypothetical protein